jgi:DNA invertase Pin-like site-specific DNA recombinase
MSAAKEAVMRTAVYCRVSTGRQEREATIKTQLDVIHQYCIREDIDFDSALKFKDEGWSGDTTLLNERPAGQALLQAALRGEIELVLVAKRDRLGRGGKARPAEDQLTAFKVRIIYVTEPHVKTRAGKRADDFQSGSYLDTFRANTMYGRARRVREGRYILPDAPYGFRKTEDNEGKTVLVVREDQAGHQCHARRHRAAGRTGQGTAGARGPPL